MSREHEPWQVLKSDYILERTWLKVREDKVQTASGNVIDEFHVLEVPSWSCVCCVDQQKRLVLVRQYRHGIGRTTLELPAGVIEPGEPPLTGAKRELLEETGHTAERWIALPSLTPEPARHTHLAHCFVALDATRVAPQKLDASEYMTVETPPIAALDALIDEGRLSHAVHVAVLLLARSKGLFSS